MVLFATLPGPERDNLMEQVMCNQLSPNSKIVNDECNQVEEIFNWAIWRAHSPAVSPGQLPETQQ